MFRVYLEKNRVGGNPAHLELNWLALVNLDYFCGLAFFCVDSCMHAWTTVLCGHDQVPHAVLEQFGMGIVESLVFM